MTEWNYNKKNYFIIFYLYLANIEYLVLWNLVLYKNLVLNFKSICYS